MSMIFPSAWQEAKVMNGIGLMNTEDVKYDRQIVYIDNISKAFKGVEGAKNTNIIYWKKNYDNGLNGKQLIYTDGKDPIEKKLNISKEDIERIPEVIKLKECIGDFVGVDTITTGRGPYSLGSDLFTYPEKYKLTETPRDKKEKDDDIRIFGIINRRYPVVKYVSSECNFPNPRKGNQAGFWKILLQKHWGGFDDDKYLGGSYAPIKIVGPADLCTESYLESGRCKDFEEAKKHSKYCMSKFARTLLLDNKFDFHNNKSSWKSVPIQDYTEDFWNSDNIDDIDNGLFDKYNVPEDIRKFVMDNIQPKTKNDILGYDGKD